MSKRPARPSDLSAWLGRRLARPSTALGAGFTQADA